MSAAVATAGAATARPRLPDLAGEFFTFVMALQSGPEPADVAELRERATTLLREFAAQARKHGVPQELIEHCRYAMVALLDEVVMTSRWALREDWGVRPLCYELFDDLNAGENVYARIEELRRQGRPDDATLDTLEVYATALCLGFRGRHGDLAGGEVVRDLITQISQKVAETRGSGDDLSPHWQPAASVRAQLKRMPKWWLAAGAFVLVALVALVLELLQGSYWSAARDALQGR